MIIMIIEKYLNLSLTLNVSKHSKIYHSNYLSAVRLGIKYFENYLNTNTLKI